jgi:hypothetical protein
MVKEQTEYVIGAISEKRLRLRETLRAIDRNRDWYRNQKIIIE